MPIGSRQCGNASYASRNLVANFANKANGATWCPNVEPIQVLPLGDQICNWCKWCRLVAKFATNANGAIWWPNLQLMKVAPSGGQICNYCKWSHLVAKFATNVKWRHLVAKFANNVSGAMLLPSLIKVTESISGSVVPLAMFSQPNSTVSLWLLYMQLICQSLPTILFNM